jgi:hypothetical protein
MAVRVSATASPHLGILNGHLFEFQNRHVGGFSEVPQREHCALPDQRIRVIENSS